MPFSNCDTHIGRSMLLHDWTSKSVKTMLPTLDRYCTDEKIAGAFENQVLYKMCRDYPKHESAYETAGKITAVGRIYSASPARGAGGSKIGRISLVKAIGERLVSSNLDKELADISCISDEKSVEKVVEIHEYLVCIIKEATSEWPAKRNEKWAPREHISFASKYLHFHRPNAFPIMDSFARAGLNCVGKKGTFTTYDRFCKAVISFAQMRGEYWTPRSIDMELVRRGRIHKYEETAPCRCCGYSKKKESATKS